jgi:CheY-like chemotaxis protein
MALTSLLVCADADAVQVLSRILQNLGIEVEVCGDSAAAAARVASLHYDAVLIDCADESAAIRFIAQVRLDARHRESIVIAIAGNENRVREIFAQGANFVLYKPISQERALHSIRAARSLIRHERRVQPRIAVRSEIGMAYAGKENASATLVDLNESGLGMLADEQLPPRCRVYFQFSLPGDRSVLRLAGEVMWQDSARRVGIRFAQVPQASRKVLQSWLGGQLPSEAEKAPTAKAATPDDSASRLSASLGMLSATAADRRDPARQPCCLGAEVYRPESSVPVRCTLTDIGSGGSYVETTEPFPEGTAVEIVVRTESLKLCISGRVRSVNRGFGMGVQFSLKNEEQHQQVKQLIACSKAESKLLG